MNLLDASPGEIVVLQDRISGEVRNVFYRRLAGVGRFEHHVRIERLGIVQGDPRDDDPPRVIRWCSPPCRDPGEADGRVAVVPLRDAVWCDLLKTDELV